MTLIKQLEDLDLRKSTPGDVRNILNNQALLCVSYIIQKGAYVLRARKGKGFTKRSELTYCPVEKCTSMQRATLSDHTMFYGVISNDSHHLENARAISICECSSLCREGIKSIGQESFTVSHWEVVKPIKIVSLVTDSIFPNVQDNSLLNMLREEYSAIHGHNNSTQEEKELAEFISNEFSKTVNDSRDYLISATIATDILSNNETDGIVFPSVMLGGQAGLNIALSTSAVNKKLRYIRAIDHTLFKNGDKSIVRMESATERNGIRRVICQVPDIYIENKLGIKDISELPIR